MSKRLTKMKSKRRHSRVPVGKANANNTIAAAAAELDQIKTTLPKAANLIALLQSWLSDTSGYDEETWPKLNRALDRERSRVGARRLFNG